MVPATGVATVGAEIATIVQSLECHAEVVTLRVQGVARMLYLIGGVCCVAIAHDVSDVDVQSSHARMSVRREVEVTVGTERGE